MASTEIQRRPVGLFPLWFGLLGGHTAWTLQLLGSYIVLSIGCLFRPIDFQILGVDGLRFALLLVSGVAVAIALAATAVAIWAWRKAGEDSRSEGRIPVGRSRFMAAFGALLSGLFVGVVLFNATTLALDPFLNPSCP